MTKEILLRLELSLQVAQPGTSCVCACTPHLHLPQQLGRAAWVHA